MVDERQPSLFGEESELQSVVAGPKPEVAKAPARVLRPNRAQQEWCPSDLASLLAEGHRADCWYGRRWSRRT